MSEARKLSVRGNKKGSVTKDVLFGKKLRTKDLQVNINGESLTWRLQAIPATDLDRLQEKHPPTKEQRARGNAVFNIDKFAPELISRCSVEPELTVEEAAELWSSENWSTGELNAIFDACTSLCMQGFNVPFTGTDSE